MSFPVLNLSLGARANSSGSVPTDRQTPDDDALVTGARKQIRIALASTELIVYINKPSLVDADAQVLRHRAAAAAIISAAAHLLDYVQLRAPQIYALCDTAFRAYTNTHARARANRRRALSRTRRKHAHIAI